MASETAISTLTMPKPVDFPPLASDPVSPESWKTLMAIMDAVAPSVQRADSLPSNLTDHAKGSTVNLSNEDYQASLASLRQYAAPSEDGLKQQDLFAAYLAERPSENPVFETVLKNILSHTPPAKKRKLEMVLSLLGTRGGSLLLTGYVTPLSSLSISDRTKILHSWRTSALYALRGLFNTFTSVGKLVHARTSAYHSPLTGFPTSPPSWVANASFPYEFLDFSSSSFTPNNKTGAIEIDTDIVIIGSGCGAGVVTHRLASTFGRNLRVLVLEKGRHFDASHFPLSQEVGLSSLMEGGGVIETEDGSITVTAGACFGGGGTVNWSASLQTQHFVRKEWAQDRRLPFFETEAFQACLDRVWGVMGVSDQKVVPNHGNKVLLEGARKLGYQARTVPQNCRGEAHEDGHCGMGCWRGEKMGPVNGWFPEAKRRGEVKFVQGMKVDRVLFGKKRKGRKGKKVAVGVSGTWTFPAGPGGGGKSVKVVVKAKKVVVSAGALWSPVVLMNSGISNPHLGKNLKLHPCSFVTAVFEHETKPWEGGCLTSVVNSFENLDGKGHGIRIEALCMLPVFALTFLPWASGLDYKLLAAKYRHLNTYFSIARDRDSGHIYRDPEIGTPQVVYTPSEYDRGNLLVGTVALCRILYVQGAKEIHPSLPGFRPFIRSSTTSPTSSSSSSDSLTDMDMDMDMDMDKTITDPAFLAWLDDLKAHGNKPPATTFASAHQMGTCRMGATASEGVVDPKGRVWGTEGLYVADASVFPSASGVNPMITNMAISDWVVQGMCKELVDEGVAVRAGGDVMARL